MNLRSLPFTSANNINTGGFTGHDWGLFSSISLIWGASFLLVDIALDAFHPGLVTFLRIGTGAATLWLLPSSRKPIASKDWLRIVVLSFVWVAVPFTIFPLSQQWVNSSLTGMLNGAMPIFATVFSAMMMRHIPCTAQFAGLLMGSLGIVAIAWSTIRPESASPIAVSFILVATMCYGFAVNLSLTLHQRYGSVPVMARVVTLAMIWTSPFGLYGLTESEFSLHSLVAVLSVGILGTGIAYWIMGTLVGRVGSVRASFITYLIPVVALMLGIVIRNDEVSSLSIFGVILATAGALMAVRREKPN